MMRKRYKLRDYPGFKPSDFVNVRRLLDTIENDSQHPIYKHLFSNGEKVLDKERALKYFFQRKFNELVRYKYLYRELKKYYKNKQLRKIISYRTQAYIKKEADFLNKDPDTLTIRELRRLRWVNFYILQDLYRDYVVQIKDKGVFRSWVDSIIIAVAFAFFIRILFIDIYKIPTSSMYPTLKPGDRILVVKLIYGPRIPIIGLKLPGLRNPRRGEVVVFIPPHDRKRQFVKRLVGLPGERISIKDGNIYINGRILTSPASVATRRYVHAGLLGSNDDEVYIPKHKYFFLGDNTGNSDDSRFWGVADEHDIIGRAIFIWWPPKRIGIIE